MLKNCSVWEFHNVGIPQTVMLVFPKLLWGIPTFNAYIVHRLLHRLHREVAKKFRFLLSVNK
jgi:hypothetical protein